MDSTQLIGIMTWTATHTLFSVAEAAAHIPPVRAGGMAVSAMHMERTATGRAYRYSGHHW